VATADGARTFDCRSDPLRDGRGRLRGWTLVLHDVTARAAEAAALQQAREVAEDTAMAQRAFLTNMNHELRTPLNGVMGMLTVLLDTELTDDQRECAEVAYRCSEELLGMVGRVMDFSAMESGRLSLESTEFGLTSVLAQALTPLQNAAQKKGLKLSLEMRPGLPPRVVGDPARLAQVAALLVDNAVKFTDSGSVRVAVSSEPAGDDAITLSIEVRDTGVGIPERRLKAIFEGFVQADGSMTRRHEGAGLGLTIAHRLVRRMGGEIDVASEVGKGSTFRFQVPLQLVTRD
jgi:signal transduction histidine kinase